MLSVCFYDTCATVECVTSVCVCCSGVFLTMSVCVCVCLMCVCPTAMFGLLYVFNPFSFMIDEGVKEMSVNV